MNRDILREDPDGFREVSVSSLDGTVSNVPDENWLAGRILDEVSLRPDGTVERGTVHHYQTVRTVDAPDGPSPDPGDPLEDAHWVGENRTVERRRTPSGTYIRRRTDTAYNGLLLFPTEVVEHGWTNQSGDERCTRTDYAFDVGGWLLDYPSSQTLFGNASCSGSVVSRNETAYDDGAVGAAPTRGNPTTVRQQIDTSTWATTTTTYDGLGRPLVVTDPNGHTTTTTYSHPSGYPQWIEVANPLGHVQRTEFVAEGSACVGCLTLGRQVPVVTLDANGRRTSYDYDTSGVWSPLASQPSRRPALRHRGSSITSSTPSGRQCR